MTSPAVAVPLPGDARYRGRRLLVLYFDLYNMPFFDQIRMYQGARQYIAAQMAPADMVAIMVFQSARVSLKTDFTDDRAALRSVIEELEVEADGRENGGGRRPSTPAAPSAKTTTPSICFRRTGSWRRCRRR